MTVRTVPSGPLFHSNWRPEPVFSSPPKTVFRPPRPSPHSFLLLCSLGNSLLPFRSRQFQVTSVSVARRRTEGSFSLLILSLTFAFFPFSSDDSVWLDTAYSNPPESAVAVHSFSPSHRNTSTGTDSPGDYSAWRHPLPPSTKLKFLERPRNPPGRHDRYGRRRTFYGCCTSPASPSNSQRLSQEAWGTFLREI